MPYNPLLSKILEEYIDENEKYDVEGFYGRGSEIQIRSMEFSPTRKLCKIDCVVILGEKIEEDLLDTEFCQHVVSDACKLFLGNYTIVCSVKFDV
jgi:hypothetical protein